MLRRALAEPIAFGFDELTPPGALSPGLAGLLQRLGTVPACVALCPPLKDAPRGNAALWSQALLRLMATDGVAPQPLPPPAPAGTWGLKPQDCGLPLTQRL